MENSEHLQWIHNRIVNVYGESRDVDFLIKFREIIKELEDLEVGFQEYSENHSKLSASDFLIATESTEEHGNINALIAIFSCSSVDSVANYRFLLTIHLK